MAEQTAMKAWHVQGKNNYYSYSTVVFAETVGKAKQLALYTDSCEDENFIDILARRIPELDQYYKPGKREMDWYDEADRITLVKLGWHCVEPHYADCPHCAASEWCDVYLGYKAEEEKE